MPTFTLRPYLRPHLRPHLRPSLRPGLGAPAVAAGVLLAVLPATLSLAAEVPGPLGPENVPLEVGKPLAPASTAAQGQTVDGIRCDSAEQVAYHVHTRLTVYVDGVLRPIPAGIGIVRPVAKQTARGPFDEATDCYYWVHVHVQDGIIHIESPTRRTYTLGQFFDLWHQPLSRAQVASARGPMVVFVNGHRYGGNPRAITLGSHKVVQIDVGSPVVAPKTVDWSITGL
ncbi:MAG TPA: hypothetical protein VHB02_03590 [Acidimicrobiales bacterium]|nr:hypothetical protein [Acidimicrobiales bacterium]